MEGKQEKPLMENAKENRNQLVKELDKKITELEEVINDINSEKNNVIGNCIKKAQDDDVNYVPDRSIVGEFLQLKNDLNVVREKLQSLKLVEATIFDEDKYLIAAEELMKKTGGEIDKKRKSFEKLNKKKLDEASDRKIKIEIGLSNSRIELNHLNLEKEKLEEQISNIKKGIIYRIKLKLFNKEGNAKTEEINYKIAELGKKKRDLDSKMNRLKMQEKAEHFVPDSTAYEDNQSEKTEEREEIESERD